MRKYLMMFWVGLASLLAFVGCSKDEKQISDSLIVGTWAESSSIEQFSFTFYSDGKGLFICKNCTTGKITETISFTYTFDKSINKLNLNGLSGNDLTILFVKFISSTTIQLFDDIAYTDKYSYVMSKQ